MSLGPAAYLPLSRSAAGVAEDVTGHGHDGSYRGAGSPGTAQLPNGDQAVTFDGHGQYVEVPSAAALSITDTGCLTVEAWVRPDVLEFPVTEGTGYVYILGKGEAAKQEYALRMYSLTNTEVPPRPSRISAYVFNRQGGLGSGAYFQDTVTPGQWMMVTFVVDSRHSARWPEDKMKSPCMTAFSLIAASRSARSLTAMPPRGRPLYAAGMRGKPSRRRLLHYA